ncbi:PrgI family protein [Candidatus Microgenomates bacterium]|nr:PrgI family protein [Candidatus Microgenomates bacterium]
MSVHKIPQNVEAEDKLLGPFTFRQFIYLFITAFAILIGYLLAQISWWLFLPMLPLILVFGILGVYHREDQPVETYLLAFINYLTKPRKRIWDSEGVVETVRLKAPKKVAAPTIRKLSAERGQLKWLAGVMDTRGWSTKEATLTLPMADQRINDDDRLVIPQMQYEPIDIHDSDDLLDPINYADAQRFADLAATSTKDAKAQAIAKMKAALAQPELGARSRESEKVQNSNSQLPTTNPGVPKVKYDPYPTQMKQKVIGPQPTASRSAAKPARSTAVPAADVISRPHELPHNNDLNVNRVAAAAKQLAEGAIPILRGQEIDLPNHQQPTAS